MAQIWIKFDKINDIDGIVSERNYVPDDPIFGVSAERRPTGIFIDSIPDEPTIIAGQGLELHINPSTLVMTWVIIEGEKTESERLLELESHSADVDYALMMGGLI